MKSIILLAFTLFSMSIFAQTNEYEVSSYLVEGFKAPNTNYLGEAWLNPLIRSDESLSYNLTKATFKYQVKVTIKKKVSNLLLLKKVTY